MSAVISQLSSFSSKHHGLHVYAKSGLCICLRTKVVALMNHVPRQRIVSGSNFKANQHYTICASESRNISSAKSYSTKDDNNTGHGTNEEVQEHVPKPKKAAKIHDFCFGIPFGGLVLTGGLVGFIFSRNPSTLSINVLFGGALLALSTISLKVWRRGKSSFPFIFGQAVLAATLLWKNFALYSSTRKLFPTGFYAAISAAMLCFYFYVVLAGGNPPPKKLRSSAPTSS